MSRKIARLVLDINLEYYAEDARFTIARNLINKAVHSGMITEDDEAIFVDEDGLPEFRISVFEIANPRQDKP